MKTSNEINEIAKAMSLAQSQMKVAETDSTNPHFRSRYANLESVIDAFRKPLCDNSLAYWQDVVTQEGQVSVTTRIAHSSGQWVEFGPLSIPLGKKDAHGIGSATTYAKRYALCAAMGVAPGEIDDDGNAAAQSVTHQAIDKKEKSKSKIQEASISEEQVAEIARLMDQADDSYNDKVMKRLDDLGYKSLNEIPISMYAMIFEGLKKNIEVVKKREKENV